MAFTDQGAGPVVVLLHGFPLNRAMWAEQVKALSASYRVIAPDLRGHGESPAPNGVYTMESMADDVVELLDELGINEPVALGGLSMGGYVTLALVLKYPERIRAVMLLDTRCTADAPQAAADREKFAQTVLDDGHPTAAVEAIVPKLFARATIEKNPGLVGMLEERMEKTPAAGVAGALRGMAIRPDQTGRLGEIKAPTLVIVGEHDAITPPDGARAMADALPASRYVLIPDAGHLTPCENPAAVNEALLAFLSGLNG